MSKRVLCLLTDGFEEIETVCPVDLLRRAGAEVVMASVGNSLSVKGRCDITLIADTTLENIADMHDFDLLLIPGGPGVKALREDGRPAKLAQRYFEQDKLIGAICAAPTVLKDAGVLQGKRYTAHFSTANELPDALTDDLVIEDGNIITSRGAGTALSFGLALVARLFDEDKSQEIAASIMR